MLRGIGGYNGAEQKRPEEKKGNDESGVSGLDVLFADEEPADDALTSHGLRRGLGPAARFTRLTLADDRSAPTACAVGYDLQRI